MRHVDRLSALMSRFELRIAMCAPADANLLVLGNAATMDPRALYLGEPGHAPERGAPDRDVLLSASVRWGQPENPLFAALPSEVTHQLDDKETRALVLLLLAEHDASRCGSASILNRLFEVLFVRLMRVQIEKGNVRTGLLGGLSDPRLSRAIVAIHENPGRPWRVEALAEEAGLSLSRFAELFRQSVGLTPLAYLRKWRLTLARQDIERGDRIQRVASRYGYGSSEALSRAVSGEYGTSPMEIRKAATANNPGLVQ